MAGQQTREPLAGGVSLEGLGERHAALARLVMLQHPRFVLRGGPSAQPERRALQHVRLPSISANGR